MFWAIEEYHCKTKGEKRQAIQFELVKRGRNICYGGKGGDAPEADPLIAQAAQFNADTARQTLDFYRQQYNEGRPMRLAASKAAIDTANQQLEIAKENQELSRDYADYNKTTFRPLEQGIVADAAAYDTTARREQEAGDAISGVRSSFDGARTGMARSAAAQGVNTNSGNYAGQLRQMAVQEAGAAAAAGNSARKQVETQGFARRMDAANLGRGLASSQATSAGVALNAGNSGVNNAQVPVNLQNQATQTMGQGLSTAGNLSSQSGQIALGGYNAELNAYKTKSDNANAGMSALGSALGAGLGFLSDKTKKKNRKAVDADKALEAIEKTPVESWQYKEGEGDGGDHIGPMAQDVQKNMGDKVAPGGKMIDVISANGINMAATQALAKRVTKIERRIKGARA